MTGDSMLWVVIAGIAVIGLSTGFLSRRASIDRTITELQGSNPEIAKALSDAQRDIDQGRFYGGL
jgi:LPXTG-motif cell wall-anchored protein